jgi:hypothetical protein
VINGGKRYQPKDYRVPSHLGGKMIYQLIDLATKWLHPSRSMLIWSLNDRRKWKSREDHYNFQAKAELENYKTTLNYSRRKFAYGAILRSEGLFSIDTLADMDIIDWSNCNEVHISDRQDFKKTPQCHHNSRKRLMLPADTGFDGFRIDASNILPSV